MTIEIFKSVKIMYHEELANKKPTVPDYSRIRNFRYDRDDIKSQKLAVRKL